MLVPPDVSLLVRGGHGLLDFDLMAVDRDLDRFLEVGRRGLVHPDQPSFEVAGKEVFLLPDRETREVVRRRGLRAGPPIPCS